MTKLQQHSQQVCEALQKAVTRALDKKQWLGQYAVIFQDGKPIWVPPEKLRDFIENDGSHKS